jgi:hypothetical protein
VTIAAGWPLASLMGLLAVIVGLLSLFGSAQIAGAPRSVRWSMRVSRGHS